MHFLPVLEVMSDNLTTKGQLIQQLDRDTFSLEHQSMGKLPLGQSIRSRLSAKAKALEHRKRKMDRNATYLK